MSNIDASNLGQGMGVLTRFVSKKTNPAPSSSPKFEPPTCLSQPTEVKARETLQAAYHDLRPRGIPKIASRNLGCKSIFKISMTVKGNRITRRKPDEFTTREQD